MLLIVPKTAPVKTPSGVYAFVGNEQLWLVAVIAIAIVAVAVQWTVTRVVRFRTPGALAAHSVHAVEKPATPIPGLTMSAIAALLIIGASYIAASTSADIAAAMLIALAFCSVIVGVVHVMREIYNRLPDWQFFIARHVIRSVLLGVAIFALTVRYADYSDFGFGKTVDLSFVFTVVFVFPFMLFSAIEFLTKKDTKAAKPFGSEAIDALVSASAVTVAAPTLDDQNRLRSYVLLGACFAAGLTIVAAVAVSLVVL